MLCLPGNLLGKGGSGAKLPLDIAGSAGAVAVSLRKLRRSYTGAALNIRRSSDNAVQDIGFAGNDFDTASFSTFVGGGNGFVAKAYDQSGAGNDLVQANTTLQPQLILSGQNGKPIMRFSSSAFLARTGFAPTTATNLTTIGVVAMYSTPGTNGRLLSFTDTSGSNDFAAGLSLASASVTAWDLTNNAGAKGNAAGKAFGFTSAAFHQLSFWYTTQGSNGSGIVADQGTPTTASPATPAATVATAFLDIGAGFTNASPQSNPLICDYAEMIIFASDLSAAASRNPIEQNQKTYWGTP